MQQDDLDIRSAVRAICAKYSLEYWGRADEEERFPEEFRTDFVTAGFHAIAIPEQYGGGGGTLSQLAAALEEVAACGGGLSATASVHIPLLCVPTLLRHGSEEQRRRWLPAIASGELFVTFGVTEPDAGTDTTKIQTFATRVEGGYLVRGAKVWNSGALRADKTLLLARTSTPGSTERKGLGLTLFMADLHADTARIAPIPKIGRRAVASCEVVFDDHFVPEDAVIGAVGEGFYHLVGGLNGERLLLAAESIGMGRWALDSASHYARERVVFERPIGQNQSVQHPLAVAYLQLLAASEVVRRGLREYDEKGGADLGTLANAAKYLATEAAFTCTDNAMQTFGGYAYAREYHIGRYWIESRLGRLAPVTNDMVLNYIAERVLQLPRSY
ncbi:MAG: acyl-CoA/acyl-ACP dehydrogenase [Geodermatophilaceae bacterium]|nr:acyl-CoA/acyl-ACP dehydrogenase [Geodermatophilaceae bacterium]